jgi:hypothetical protein
MKSAFNLRVPFLRRACTIEEGFFMSRVLVRRAAVMIVVVALTLVALPAAYARPLAGPHSTAGGGMSWTAALSTWVSSFLFGAPTVTAPVSHQKAASSTLIPITDFPKVHPMTGTCIDPNGHPVPCNPS